MPPADPIRFVKATGLFSFSRGRDTCLWTTRWCSHRCFNKKFYSVNPKLPDRDVLDEAFWQGRSVSEIVKIIRDLDVKRFRFAVRGEIWTRVRDVGKVRDIMSRCPDTLFWIPTRAWRGKLRLEIEMQIMRLCNSRVMASIDPTTTPREELVLRESGWSMLFAGDNNLDQLVLAPAGVADSRTKGFARCAKTWKGAHGHCAVCEEGCFSAARVDVHLKQHR
jgi:hypothetical protein